MNTLTVLCIFVFVANIAAYAINEKDSKRPANPPAISQQSGNGNKYTPNVNKPSSQPPTPSNLHGHKRDAANNGNPGVNSNNKPGSNTGNHGINNGYPGLNNGNHGSNTAQKGQNQRPSEHSTSKSTTNHNQGTKGSSTPGPTTAKTNPASGNNPNAKPLFEHVIGGGSNRPAVKPTKN